MRFIDLFAGIGGIKIGFENAGFQCVFSNDFDTNAKITFDFNFMRKTGLCQSSLNPILHSLIFRCKYALFTALALMLDSNKSNASSLYTDT